MSPLLSMSTFDQREPVPTADEPEVPRGSPPPGNQPYLRTSCFIRPPSNSFHADWSLLAIELGGHWPTHVRSTDARRQG